MRVGCWVKGKIACNKHLRNEKEATSIEQASIRKSRHKWRKFEKKGFRATISPQKGRENTKLKNLKSFQTKTPQIAGDLELKHTVNLKIKMFSNEILLIKTISILFKNRQWPNTTVRISKILKSNKPWKITFFCWTSKKNRKPNVSNLASRKIYRQNYEFERKITKII